MSQAKVDEAIWFESLVAAPTPAPVATAPLAAPRKRRWFGFLRRR